jgi:hypothetical protein
LAVLAALLPGPARAWDAVGHRIVAAIAERLLTAEAIPEVRGLLVADGNASLVDVANWAEGIQRVNPETARWHVVPIPFAAAGYDPARDCPNGNCLVERIEAFRRLLADRKAEPRARVEALKWLVHLVADLHQPMRCIDNGDTLGHELKLRWFGRTTSLHAIWDTDILQRLGRPDHLEARLAESVSRDDARLWSSGAPAEWAVECRDLARRAAYGTLPQARHPEIGQGYQSAAARVVEHQLLRAGIRLGGVINGAFLRTEKPWWQIWSPKS